MDNLPHLACAIDCGNPGVKMTEVATIALFSIVCLALERPRMNDPKLGPVVAEVSPIDES